MAVNTRYTAFASEGQIYTLRLPDLHDEPQHLSTPELCTAPCVLSQGQSSLLAVPCATRAYIVDLITRNVTHTINGIGRAITSVAFATGDDETIATGHVDGSIFLWDLGLPNRPKRRLSSNAGDCHGLGFSPHDPDSLVSLTSGGCYLWKFKRSGSHPVCVLGSQAAKPLAFAWHPHIRGRLAICLVNGELLTYDLADVDKSPNGTVDYDSSDGEDTQTLLKSASTTSHAVSPTLKLTLDAPLACISWSGKSAILGLVQGARDGLLIEVKEHDASPEVIWSCQFRDSMDSIYLRKEGEDTLILGVGPAGVEVHNFQEVTSVNVEREAAKISDYRSDEGKINGSGMLSEKSRPGRKSPAISPFSISQLRSEKATFKRLSRQLQTRRRSIQRTSTPLGEDGSEHSKALTNGQPSSKSPPSKRSSLEVRYASTERNVISPMPFLSPGIPGRTESPHEIPPLDQAIFPPPQLEMSTSEPSISSNAPEAASPTDSEDSDDEAFVEDLQGSVPFLPGGVNTPLPKHCGALFAPNGQLLVYFPPKPRHSSERINNVDSGPLPKTEEAKGIVKMFPTFGNLQNDSGYLSGDSDMDDSNSLHAARNTSGTRLDGSFHPLTPVRRSSLTTQTPFALLIQDEELHRSKVIISIHEIDQFQIASPAQHKPAANYRALCRRLETGAQLCLHNGEAAERNGQQDVGEMWWMLAMLLEDKIPLETLMLGPADESILVIVQRAKLLTSSNIDTAITKSDEFSGKLRWAVHPFSGAWLVGRIIEWAEQRADVQFLAYATAILSQARHEPPLKHADAEHSFLRHLPSYSSDYFTAVPSKAASQPSKRSVPLLRTHAATITSMYESPTKSFRDATNPWQASSQRTPPYLDPENAPSWSFSGLVRHATQLSTASSISPELGRNSFSPSATRSTAYYSQSFSDRSGSFGTSPTSRKLETNVSTPGELSSSLPGGSWLAKSVSFASSTAANTSNGSFKSANHPSAIDEDDNDSDKTLEENSVPHTPRSPAEVVSVLFNDRASFGDDVSGFSRARFLPEYVEDNVRIWCQYYSDLLRSWDMYTQAAELEKAIGLTIGVQGSAADSAGGVFPKFRSDGRRTACTICERVASGVVQLCPSCLHAVHFICLDQYAAELDDEEYSCPSGCGCACSELGYSVQEISTPSPPRPPFRKKPSFTDPRRWRARVDGDSW